LTAPPKQVAPPSPISRIKLSLKSHRARHRWLTPVILVTQEAEIRRIEVRRQPRKIVQETLSQKNLSHTKKRSGGVAYGVGPEFKPWYHQKKKKKNLTEPPRDRFVSGSVKIIEGGI
jgi:hypothetical protein